MCCPSLYMPVTETEGFYFGFVFCFSVFFFPAAASTVVKKTCQRESQSVLTRFLL